MPRSASLHSYRIEVVGDGRKPAGEIEFEAITPEAALRVAHRYCADRAVQLYEDGRKLADVEYVASGGFWVIGSGGEPSPFATTGRLPSSRD